MRKRTFHYIRLETRLIDVNGAVLRAPIPRALRNIVRYIITYSMVPYNDNNNNSDNRKRAKKKKNIQNTLQRLCRLQIIPIHFNSIIAAEQPRNVNAD